MSIQYVWKSVQSSFEMSREVANEALQILEKSSGDWKKKVLFIPGMPCHHFFLLSCLVFPCYFKHSWRQNTTEKEKKHWAPSIALIHSHFSKKTLFQGSLFIEWLGLEGTFKDYSVQPHWHGQEHLPVDARLHKASSNQTLNTSNDGTFTTSLGSLF